MTTFSSRQTQSVIFGQQIVGITVEMIGSQGKTN